LRYPHKYTGLFSATEVESTHDCEPMTTVACQVQPCVALKALRVETTMHQAPARWHLWSKEIQFKFLWNEVRTWHVRSSQYPLLLACASELPHSRRKGLISQLSQLGTIRATFNRSTSCRERPPIFEMIAWQWQIMFSLG
jgi:hypothetical protein